MSKAERRAAARLAAAQALYEFEAHWIGREVEGDQYNPAELAFFRDVVSGVLKDQHAIDRGLDAALARGWPLKRVEALMRAILRAAYYELKGRPDVPARVVITEYVDIAGAFFGPEESGMINAVLDALARESRPAEFQARA
jgi:N utilization substance protein B